MIFQKLINSNYFAVHGSYPVTTPITSGYSYVLHTPLKQDVRTMNIPNTINNIPNEIENSFVNLFFELIVKPLNN